MRILAESAALGCFILLTSDGHLRAVDFQRLSFELASFDLTAPVIAPREIVRSFPMRSILVNSDNRRAGRAEIEGSGR